MPTASPTPYPPTCGLGRASDLALSWPDYEFLEAFVAHNKGLEEEILEPSSPWLDAEPCWAVPLDPTFSGPAWSRASLCAEVTLDVLSPVGFEVFQFLPISDRGVPPLTFEAEPAHGDTSPNGMFRVDPSSGLVTVNSNLALYCGCAEEGWVDVHVELADSNSTRARQTGTLWIQLTGCDEPVCPSATPSHTASGTSTLSVSRSASGTPTLSVSRAASSTATRPASRTGTRRRVLRA